MIGTDGSYSLTPSYQCALVNKNCDDITWLDMLGARGNRWPTS